MRFLNFAGICLIVLSVGIGSAVAKEKASPTLQKAADQCFGKIQVGWPEMAVACSEVLKAKISTDARAGALFNRGSAYLHLGGGKTALADFNAALKIKPDFARALEQRAAILVGQKKLDLALVDLNKAISIDAKSSAAYNNRGLLYLGKKDYPKAIADLTRAIELEPNDPKSYSGRGTAYVAKGDGVSALADFNKAISLDSKMTVALYNRGMLFAAKGEKDKAKADFEAILVNDPDNKGAKGALAALEKKAGG